MKPYNEDGLRNLADAIIIQAAEDLRTARSGREDALTIVRDTSRSARERTIGRGQMTRCSRRITELETFFSGGFYRALAGDAADTILSGLRVKTGPAPTR